MILILKHQQTYHTHTLFLRGDKFLFEALSTIGARPVKFLIDEKGKVYGRDYRVWRSLRWVTLDPTLWPPQLTKGYNMPTPGPQQPTNLACFAVSCALHGLSEVCFIHPCTASILLGGLLFTTPGGQFVSIDGLFGCKQLLCAFASAGPWSRQDH